MAIPDENPSRVLPLPKDTKPADVEKESKKLVDDFRAYMLKPPPVLVDMGVHNLVTNITLAALLAPMAAEIKAIHGEVVNPKSVELLQQARLDTLAAAWKKYLEGNSAWWQYFAFAAAGIIVTLVSAGLLMRLGAFIVSKLPTFFTGGVGAGQGLTPAQVNALRDALVATNPLLKSFVDDVRRLPRAKELTARAKAIGKLNEAVEAQNNTLVREAAEAIKQLKLALRNFDPKRLPTNHSALKKTADSLDRLRLAIGRLKIDDVRAATQALLRLKVVIRNLKPENIPKSGDMRSAAGAANSLDKAARRLTGSLTPLGPALRGVSAAAAATAGNLGA
ncbi:hypothetical protein [Streptomyces sp. NPDC058701]|uniref:hypothetical protein n=1 Tax=Streptomyces sp. NPDC058701 TaxID=3346608 RepID=UPI00364C4EF4